MQILDAVLLGVVEGLTEFLPISSTGHLILMSRLLGLTESEFLKTFEISIQMGAILAVVFLYWKKLLLDIHLCKRLLVALVPALGVGFLFYASIREMLESEKIVVGALCLGGILIIAFEQMHRGKEGTEERLSQLPYKTAFLIGLFQALAVIPGVSRAGATIIGGLFLGLKRTAIVEFSFLLAVPTMIAATTLDIAKNAAAFSTSDVHFLLIGFCTAFIVAIFAVKFFLRFVQTHTFVTFGVYRIVIALLFFLFVI